MRKILVIALLMSLILAIPAFAEDTGPTISSVTGKILNVVREDGRWYPGEGWWIKGVPSGQEVKTEVIDSSGKVVSWATFSTQSKGKGWSKTNDVTKRWPTEDYDKLYKFTPGSYTLKVKVGDNVIWETPFTVNCVKRDGRDFFAVSGPWKDVALCYTGKGSRGLILEWWTEGPTDMSWHNPNTTERRFNVKADVKKDGKVILEESDDANQVFYIRPGEASKMKKSVSFEREVKEKILSTDGEYEFTAYVNVEANKWVPVVKLKFQVKGGKVATNPKYSGDGIDAKHRYITSDAWYGENLVKEKLPPYKGK